MIRLALGGLLAIPSLLIMVVVAPAVALLSIPSMMLLSYQKRKPKDADSALNYDLPIHVIITGGSSGIGLAIAKQAIDKGIATRVSILARNKEKLEAAKTILHETKKKSTKSICTDITAHSLSVSDPSALEQVAKELLSKKTQPERVLLFNCAGISHTTYFDNVTADTMERTVKTNQLGAMYTIKAFAPYLINQPTAPSTIILTSSAAGQVGVFGYSAYSPTKFALRGFAETLFAELAAPHPQIAIQVAFPVDTETPGYAEEIKMMPEETKIINDSAGIASADETGGTMLSKALAKNPSFCVYFNFEGWMLSNLTIGMGPITSVGEGIAQVSLMHLFRFVSMFYLNDWWNTIQRMHDDKRNKKISTDDPTSYGSIDDSKKEAKTSAAKQD